MWVQKRHTNRPCWTRSPDAWDELGLRCLGGSNLVGHGTEARSGVESGKELGRDPGRSRRTCLRHRAGRCTVDPSSVWPVYSWRARWFQHFCGLQACTCWAILVSRIASWDSSVRARPRTTRQRPPQGADETRRERFSFTSHGPASTAVSGGTARRLLVTLHSICPRPSCLWTTTPVMLSTVKTQE